jgi:GT2 family glycosyltransferase
VQSHDCHWSPVLGWRRGRHPRPGDDAYPIFGDIFAAPIISLDIVKRLRLLPQGFHSYGEDFDACYAVAMAGERIVRDSSIVVQHALSQSRPESPHDLYVVQVQAVRNVLASAMLNYGRAALWISFPLLFLKMWLHELLWRQRGLLRKCGLVPRQFFSLPVEVLRLHTSQRALRQLRQDQRARSDLAVWRLP